MTDANGPTLLAVSAGGALGSLTRWAAGAVVPHAAPGFPWATFLVNLTGALLLGAVAVLLADTTAPRRRLGPFLTVGFLGGFTTFSAYALETRDLLAEGEYLTAGIYAGGTLAGGLLAVLAGTAAARGLLRSRRKRRARAGDRSR